jgi:hypothetical protein
MAHGSGFPQTIPDGGEIPRAASAKSEASEGTFQIGGLSQGAAQARAQIRKFCHEAHGFKALMDNLSIGQRRHQMGCQKPSAGAR